MTTLETPAARLGAYIASTRGAAKMSQSKLGAIAGCSQPEISRWEAGEDQPSLAQVYKMASKVPGFDAEVALGLLTAAARRAVAESSEAEAATTT